LALGIRFWVQRFRVHRFKGSKVQDSEVQRFRVQRFVAGIDIFRAPAIMNASYFMNGILLTLSR